ncbi:hypothetical protein LCGC14_1936480, partial [marine sediment metagenome]
FWVDCGPLRHAQLQGRVVEALGTDDDTLAIRVFVEAGVLSIIGALTASGIFLIGMWAISLFLFLPS